MKPIVGIGELLWDIYPDGRKVAGGAPFNFAFHCHQLGHPAVIVSRVGDDDLGCELRERVRELGLSDEYIQTDREHATGTVQVSLDANKVPTYTITENVAWDFIAWEETLRNLAGQAAAVCFGTLALRENVSRDSILRLLDYITQESNALRVFDMNLRQRFYSADILRRCWTAADWVKVNDDELIAVAQIQGKHWENSFVAMIDLCMRTGDWPHVPKRAILSQGNRGSTIVEMTPDWDESIGGYRYEEEWVEEPGVPVRVIDTVGAGDAFTAAMVCLHLEGRPLRECARFANHYAARVCEHQGAAPRIDRAAVERAAGLRS